MTKHSKSVAHATVYGYPRQGPDRQLKKAIEAYWAGRLDASELLSITREIRIERLIEMQKAGIDEIPSNDFSLYDHVLDTAVMLGAIPARHRLAVPDVTTTAGRLDRYFAMARGTNDVAPLEMTKWFDTNYHYLVPELGPATSFRLDSAKVISEFVFAKTAGILTRPTIVGPLTFLLLAKADERAPDDFEPINLLDPILRCYQELLRELHNAGVEWVQFDEPALVCDQPAAVLQRVAQAYELLGTETTRPKITVASYFGRLGDALPVLVAAPIDGLAIDFTGHAVANLEALAAVGGLPSKRLIAGVVDGRNVWTTDFDRAFRILTDLSELADHVDVAASCSLLHVPLDVELETNLDPSIRPWISFARQKLVELALLAKGLNIGRVAIADSIAENQTVLGDRANSPIAYVAEVRHRSSAVSAEQLRRSSVYQVRRIAQRERLDLPMLPTTTIGSFPQTSGLRKKRASLTAGTLDEQDYELAMSDEIRSVIALQDDLGLDVFVHGEAERNDMVQYFAEQLDGFVTTSHGWVQSYGSRYVRPPILVGDVSRPDPMTVRWATFAQGLTNRPVKGMLTGPVTMLAWSFVRDDLPLSETARQLSFALRDEVLDLERAGIAIIQVDEPAFREMLPLRQGDWTEYLEWAVQAFRLTTSGVRDETQIHTHMCYAEFGNVLAAIIDMDADVISLEAARSRMQIVSDLAQSGYPNEVGPGVWDIHSPRIPSTAEITDLLRSAIAVFPPDRLWVNPDCGLKTRDYEQVRASLANLVAAANVVRATL